MRRNRGCHCSAVTSRQKTKGLKEFLLDLERIADRVILDAGFNGESTYVPLEESGVYYLMRLTIG